MTTADTPSMKPPTQSRTVVANGVRVHYRRSGDGPTTVVLLHGFPQTGRLWDRVAATLASRFTVIVPDLRGAGGSERPATGYDKKTMAADVHALVTALGLGPVHMVGHDIGGMVAYAYAAQWPQDVADLTMIEMLLPGFGIEATFAIRQPGRFAHMPFFMTDDLPEWLLAGKEVAFLDWFIRNNLVDQTAFSSADISAYAAAYARPGALRAAFDWFRAFWQDAEDNKRFASTKLAMPVLAIGGSQNVGTFLEQSLPPVAEDVRGLVFEHCGHFLPDEQPDRLARELETFFEASPSR